MKKLTRSLVVGSMIVGSLAAASPAQAAPGDSRYYEKKCKTGIVDWDPTVRIIQETSRTARVEFVSGISRTGTLPQASYGTGSFGIDVHRRSDNAELDYAAGSIDYVSSIDKAAFGVRHKSKGFAARTAGDFLITVRVTWDRQGDGMGPATCYARYSLGSTS